MEILWTIRGQATTTDVSVDATTSGPFKIPDHAPDIAAFFGATTVASDGYDVFIGTTNGGDIVNGLKTWAKSISTNRRCFSIAAGKTFATGTPIKIRYRAVGELVRS